MIGQTPVRPTSAVDSAAEASTLLGETARWFAAFVVLVEWRVLSMRLLFPVMVTVQVMVGAGLGIGLGFLFDSVPPEQALYLASGAVVLPLFMLGFVAVPQQVANGKLDGTIDFLWALPVPRTALYLSMLVVASATALPGSVLALVLVAMRYRLELDVSLLIIPSAALVVLVAAAIGYALAIATSEPRLIGLLTQVLMFGLIAFAPINFPPERLPGWLAWIHQWLPAQHAGTLIRGTLVQGAADGFVRAFATLGLWAVASWFITFWALSRRQ